MSPHEFIQKWQAATLSERSACHQHFLDLCDLLGQPKPAEADPEGAWYTFERGVNKVDGGNGWADAGCAAISAWDIDLDVVEIINVMDCKMKLLRLGRISTSRTYGWNGTSFLWQLAS